MVADGNQVFESVWLTVLSFEALLFTISIAFILLAMAKERTEHRHKTAALIDPLTGIANRRAFLQDGEAQLQAAGERAAPIAVMLLDLDNFKSINDRFGHAVGDRVLQIFAEVGERSCDRPIDLFGRLGGEEFAAMLLDTGRETGAGGRRARSAPRFARPPREVDGRPVAATVSIGIVISRRRRARPSGAARAGRPGALSRQGQWPQPYRGCFDRSRARPYQARDGRASGRARQQRHGQIRGLSRVT